MPLKVNLRAGERIIINGALISADSSIGLTIHNKVTLMLERQLVRPEEATTPARRIYFAIQNAYVSDPEEQPAWLDQANRYIDDYAEATTTPAIRKKVAAIRLHLASSEYYAALRLARELFAHDDKMLSMGGSGPEGQPTAGE
ncbi:flagellar biosynthesis repressor FlbT [Azospirillum sp.]|uniref:flagellar biosynthesis repressor FlbT n=1 Tax=Azospirillum sp. TaxID=34012 RepID=UPI003D71EF62